MFTNVVFEVDISFEFLVDVTSKETTFASTDRQTCLRVTVKLLGAECDVLTRLFGLQAMICGPSLARQNFVI